MALVPEADDNKGASNNQVRRARRELSDNSSDPTGLDAELEKALRIRKAPRD
jgi:hypothetical protein